MIRLDGQIALVTGAARGLGLEYTRLFAARGAHVIMQDNGTDQNGKNSDPNIVVEAANRISKETRGMTTPVSTDLADRNQARQLVSQILRKYGRLDIFVHNAGWVAYEEIEKLSPELLQRAIDVNILIPTWLAQAIFPIMKKNNYGRIVLTSSDRAIYGEYALAGLSAYAMGKMAQIGLMNILAAEKENYNIQINTVSPVCKTRMWDTVGEPEDLRPSQVAHGVLYLVSTKCHKSGYILRASNGQFTAVKWLEREDVNYPYDLKAFKSETAEGLAINWNSITNSVRF